MKTISTYELRSKTKPLVQALEQGVAIGLTHRGRKLARIVPLPRREAISERDLLYHFHQHAEGKASSLTDQAIDAEIYGR